MSARLTGVSPVLLVADVDRGVEYYPDRLGFRCQDPDGYDIAFGQRR